MTNSHTLKECENNKFVVKVKDTINLDKEDLIKTKEFIDTLNNVERVDVLPYHTLGVHKYKDLGLKATFIIYEGNHHTVFNNCDKLFSDVDNFMLDCKKNHKITL